MLQLTLPSKLHGYHPSSFEQFNDSAEGAQILVQSRLGVFVGSTGIPGSAIVGETSGDAAIRPTREARKMTDFMVLALLGTMGLKMVVSRD